MYATTEKLRPVLALAPVASNAVTESSYVDLTNCNRAIVVCETRKGNAALTSFSLRENGAAVAAQLMANTSPLWVNLNTATQPLTRPANANTYALDNADDGRGQVVVFEIDPARLSDGYTEVRVDLGATNAANIVSVTFLLDQKYSG